MVSAGLGALVFTLVGDNKAGCGEWLYRWRQEKVIDGRVGEIGLVVLIVWAASQLAPFAPSLDVGDIRNGLKQVWLTMLDLSRLNLYRIVIYACSIAALGAVLRLVLRLRRQAPLLLTGFCGLVLVGKIMIVGRQLSLEAIIGLAIGLVVTAGLVRFSEKLTWQFGAVATTTAFIVDELRPDYAALAVPDTFNWIPFGSQMLENVSGIGSIIAGLWPFAMLGFFALFREAATGEKIPFVVATVGITASVFALEFVQTGITGRYADITTVLLAVIGWLMIARLLTASRDYS
jgi:hypothetical protein